MFGSLVVFVLILGGGPALLTIGIIHGQPAATIFGALLTAFVVLCFISGGSDADDDNDDNEA